MHNKIYYSFPYLIWKIIDKSEKTTEQTLYYLFT